MLLFLLSGVLKGAPSPCLRALSLPQVKDLSVASYAEQVLQVAKTLRDAAPLLAATDFFVAAHAAHADTDLANLALADLPCEAAHCTATRTDSSGFCAYSSTCVHLKPVARCCSSFFDSRAGLAADPAAGSVCAVVAETGAVLLRWAAPGAEKGTAAVGSKMLLLPRYGTTSTPSAGCGRVLNVIEEFVG